VIAFVLEEDFFAAQAGKLLQRYFSFWIFKTEGLLHHSYPF